MFQLRSSTARSWLDKVLPHLDQLLVEQAHLEKKAASGALTFLFRYPETAAMQRPLSELAREELEHFEETLGLLEDRRLRFGRQKPGPYAGRLLKVLRDDEPERMLDQMLCHAVIEARSCERMKLLSEGLRGIGETGLADFYYRLVVSEARHHGLWVQLAETEFPADAVAKRLEEVLEHEARVLERATDLPRLHN